MALNIELIKQLYRGLKVGEKNKLRDYVWPKCGQNVSYFDKTKRPSYEIVEKFADFMGITVDSLRLDPLENQTVLPGTDIPRKQKSSYKKPKEEVLDMAAEEDTKYKSAPETEKVTASCQDAQNEIQQLKDKIASLENFIRLKDQMIAVKEAQLGLISQIAKGEK